MCLSVHKIRGNKLLLLRNCLLGITTPTDTAAEVSTNKKQVGNAIEDPCWGSRPPPGGLLYFAVQRSLANLSFHFVISVVRVSGALGTTDMFFIVQSTCNRRHAGRRMPVPSNILPSPYLFVCLLSCVPTIIYCFIGLVSKTR